MARVLPLRAVEELLPGDVASRRHRDGILAATQHDDFLDGRRVAQRVVHDALERDVFALAIHDVRREQRSRTGESHAFAERSRSEASEYHEDHGPDADGAEHEDDRLRTRRHVDRDPVALVDPKSAQRGRDALRLLEQLRVREGLALAALVLGDERDALAVAGPDVMVDAVVREVRAPSEVPAERRLLPVEDALPGFLSWGLADLWLVVVYNRQENIRGAVVFWAGKHGSALQGGSSAERNADIIECLFVLHVVCVPILWG